MMKTKVLTICVVMAVLAIGSTAQATTIRDRAEYRPSTNIYFTESTGRMLGHTQTSGEFQMNVEYQSGILDTAIDTFNDREGAETEGLAFGDAPYYYLDMSGSADIWYYGLDGQYPWNPNGSADSPHNPIGTAEWTLTYWEGTPTGGNPGKWAHTILSGTIDGDYLEVDPQVWRAFDNVAAANDDEIWNGALLDCEMLGYTVSSVGDGVGLLTVSSVPEPATLCLLGLGGLLLRRRKRA